MCGPVSAILLAAGLSRRMGRPKQLLLLQGKPLIRHCLEAMLEGGIARPVVVLGPESESIQRVIEDLPFTLAFNHQRDSEMADSVRAGLHAVDHTASGVFISLSDHPLVSAATYSALMDLQRNHPDEILIPTYEEKRGHPTLFPFKVLQQIFPCGSLREILHANPERIRMVPIADAGVVRDLDTEADYRELCEGPYGDGAMPSL